MKFSIAIFLAVPLLAAAFEGTNLIDHIEQQFHLLRDAKIQAKSASGSAPVITTRNELIDGALCKNITLIFARGTTEPGNVGDDVGPMFFDELEALRPGRLMVQGVNDYPADIWGFLTGGSRTGAKDMVKSVSLAASRCPDSRIVLSGFSQGAQVVHIAGGRIPSKLHSKIAAIVLFGDPRKGEAFPGTLNQNVKTFCNDGDWICDGLPIPTPPHQIYEEDAKAAAEFVGTRIN